MTEEDNKVKEVSKTKLFCAVDSKGEIQEGSLGFYKEETLKSRFPNFDVIDLKELVIPKDYAQDCFKIVKEGDDSVFQKKSAAVIKAIRDKKKDSRRLKSLDAMLAIDPDTLNDDLKAVVVFLQERFGKK